MMKAKDSDAKVIAGKIITYLQSKGKSNLISDVAKCLLVSAEVKKVCVYYATNLTKEQKSKIISKFSKITQSDNFDFILDKNVLDGIIVKFNDKTWDLSLRNYLEKIRYL
jgi:F0F1-type ATP synthase delta subunit